METRRRELAEWEAHAELAALRFYMRSNKVHDVLDTLEGLLVMCKCTACKGDGWQPDPDFNMSEYDRTKHRRKPGESQHVDGLNLWQLIINMDGDPVPRFACNLCKCRGSVIQPWAIKVRHALRWALDAVTPLATTLHTPEIQRQAPDTDRHRLSDVQSMLCLYDVSTATRMLEISLKLNKH